MTVTIYSKKQVERMISYSSGVQGELYREARRLQGRAEKRLESIRGSTKWYKIADPGNLTRIEVDGADGKYGQDWLVSLVGHKMSAGAIEYGHMPSGIFGPGGKFADVKTKPPKATYLMTMTWVQA